MSDSRTLKTQWRELQKEIENILEGSKTSFFSVLKEFVLEKEEVCLISSEDYRCEKNDILYSNSKYKEYWKSNKGVTDESQVKYPRENRLKGAVRFLTEFRNWLFEKKGVLAPPGKVYNEKAMIRLIGLDQWNDFRKNVIERVNDQETQL